MRLKYSPSSSLLDDRRWVKKITRRDLAVEISQLLIGARFKVGLTQVQLAKKIGTKQSGVARAESGRGLPSLAFLDKVAKALKTNIAVSFESMPDVVPTAVRHARLRGAAPKTEMPASSGRERRPAIPTERAKAQVRAST
jgi:transcriptional regulator with XRE-family HTH domain